MKKSIFAAAILLTTCSVSAEVITYPGTCMGALNVFIGKYGVPIDLKEDKYWGGYRGSAARYYGFEDGKYMLDVTFFSEKELMSGGVECMTAVERSNTVTKLKAGIRKAFLRDVANDSFWGK